MKNNTLSITNARKNIYQISDDIAKSSAIYTLTDKGKSKVIMMSVEEFESWQETLAVLETFPNLKQDIKDAEKDLEEGKTVSIDDL